MNSSMRAAVAAILAAGLFSSLGAGAGEPPAGKTYYMRGRKGRIKYTVKERDVGGSGAVAVEVWYTKDGGRWQKYGEDRNLDVGTMIFEAAGEGVYDFATVAVDRVGNREKTLNAQTAIEFQVVVDHTQPKVTAKREAPAGELLSAKGEVTYSWTAQDKCLGDKPVDLQVKFEKEHLWRSVERGLEAKGEKTFHIKAAAEGVAEVRFLAVDRAGNRGYGPAGKVKFDMLAPTGRVLGPRLATKLDVEISFEASDRGPSGLKSVSVWVTEDRGRTWRKLADAPPLAGSVKVRLAKPGEHGLSLSAVDQAGNQLPPPKPGDRPQLIMLTDTDAPRLTIVGLDRVEAKAFSSRDSLDLRWKALDENLEKNPVTVEFSSDGGDSWKVVAEKLANDKKPRDESYTGSYSWRPPSVNSSRCLLRITAVDKSGNKTPATTRPFTVDNNAPESAATFEPIPDEEPETPVPEKTEPEKKGSATKKSSSRAPDAQVLLAQAQHFLERGMKKQAVEKAAKVIALKPPPERAALGAAHLIRGRALAGSDDATALGDLEKALEINPDAEGLHDDLATVSFRQGEVSLDRNRIREARVRFRRAAASFEIVAAKGKSSAREHYNLGVVLVRLSQVEGRPQNYQKRAEANLKKAVAAAGGDRQLVAECHWWLAVLAESRREFREAARLWSLTADMYGKRTALGKKALARAQRAARRRR